MLDSSVFLTINILTNFAQKYANLLHKISPSTSFIGQKHLFTKTVGSTNELAKQLNKEKGVENGFLLWSDYQSNGRGRNGKTWLGEAGLNIYASFVLKPFRLETPNLPYLNFACTLAVFDVLNHYLQKQAVQIKWPNDLIVNDKKIAGILIENQLGPKYVSSVVFGLGINVNQSRFPIGLEHATSLTQQKGIVFRKEDILERLCEYLETRFEQLESMQYELLYAQYNHLVYRRGQEIQFTHDRDTHLGILNGISRAGELIIKTKDKEEHFLQGEIKLDVYGLSH
jgi:BirA family transcriptional regulator, biotin operon repressor / biotin---[acetyl-CoA-carboxylase] ligase